MELLVYGGKVIFSATYKELHIVNRYTKVQQILRSSHRNENKDCKNRSKKLIDSFNFGRSKRIEVF